MDGAGGGAGGGAGAGAGGNVIGSVGEGATGVASEEDDVADGRGQAAEAEKEAIDGMIARLSVPAPPAGLHLKRVPDTDAARDRAVDAGGQREKGGAFPPPGEFAAAAAGVGLDDDAGGVRGRNPPDSGVGVCTHAAKHACIHERARTGVPARAHRWAW